MPLNVKSFLYSPPVGLRRGGGEVLPLVRGLHAGHEDEPQHPVLHQQPPPPVNHPHTCHTCHVTIEQICHEISITGASRGFWHDHTSRPSGNAVINMRKYWKFKLFNGNHFALFRFDDIISTIVPLIVYHQKVCGTHRDLFKHFTLIDLYMRPTLNLQLKVISFNWTLKLLRDQRGPVLFYFQIFNKAFHSPTISSQHLNETFVGHEIFFVGHEIFFVRHWYFLNFCLLSTLHSLVSPDEKWEDNDCYASSDLWHTCRHSLVSVVDRRFI